MDQYATPFDDSQMPCTATNVCKDRFGEGVGQIRTCGDLLSRNRFLAVDCPARIASVTLGPGFRLREHLRLEYGDDKRS